MTHATAPRATISSPACRHSATVAAGALDRSSMSAASSGSIPPDGSFGAGADDARVARGWPPAGSRLSATRRIASAAGRSSRSSCVKSAASSVFDSSASSAYLNTSGCAAYLDRSRPSRASRSEPPRREDMVRGLECVTLGR
jgi:hypothetical protein